jgi:hypothetical protein
MEPERQPISRSPNKYTSQCRGFLPLTPLERGSGYCKLGDPILPTGAAQLIVNLKEDRTRLYETDPPHRWVSTCGTILAGVQSRYQIIDTSEQQYVAGVAFRPGGSTAFVRAPAHETRDVSTPLEFLWNRQRTADLREQLLERDDPEAQSMPSRTR